MDKTERLDYLERSRTIVDQFMAVLDVVLHAVLDDSSLLEVALDYNLALTMYATLKAAMQASVQLMVARKKVPKSIALWDDGLSGVR